MYALSLCTLKCQQFCVRICSKGCCRVQKIPLNLNQEKYGAKKKWWIKSFENIFGRYLLLTNTISSGVLMALGDLIQQEIEYIKYGKHIDSFDWHRSKNKLKIQVTKKQLKAPAGANLLANLQWNMGKVGTIQGPLSHFFYKLLDKNFPGKKAKTILKKVFLDQTVGSPVFISLFFGSMNYFENKTFEETKAEIREKFWLVYCVDCLVWIPAQILNFYCVSAVYRVIYVNLLTTCYNVFLSFAKHAN